MNALSSLTADATRPRHVAIIMDGNGRWAVQRGQPRALGHRAGVRAARHALRFAAREHVPALTVFAFSHENWRRPESEVSLLIQLFTRTLTREMNRLHENGVRLHFMGEHGGFPPRLREAMAQAMALTRDNTAIRLNVAVGYGGQQALAQAAATLASRGEAITVSALQACLEPLDTPPPDLLIRTGGERRISNFLLWQLAYAELYFCDTLWPDFRDEDFAAALHWFAARERRFGGVGVTAC